MKRNAIIKALRICACGGECSQCPLHSECTGDTNIAMALAIQLLINDMGLITHLFEIFEEACDKAIDGFVDAKAEIKKKENEILEELKEVDE